MNIKQTLIFLIVGITSLCVADERISLKARINDKRVHLCFDSGSPANVLAPQIIKKLGLKFIPAPTNDLSRGVLAGDTEYCNLTIDGFGSGPMNFFVFDVPAYTSLDVDGIIGWWSLSDNIVNIDAVAEKVTSLSAVPKKANQWTQFFIVPLTNSGALDVQIPHAGRTNGVLRIDTGTGSGLALPDAEWKLWREKHPHSPITLDARYTPSDGFFVTQEAWADQIAIGPLVLTNVPIMRAGPAGAAAWGAQYEGTLGLAALKRLDVIADGKSGVAYFHAKNTRPSVYHHNRLGAIFLTTTTHTNQAVAQVVDGSPAYEAGLRNGDILLQVDEIAVTGWYSDWIDRFYRPAGTKLKLMLSREGKIYKTTATLRDILKPDSSKNPSSAN